MTNWKRNLYGLAWLVYISFSMLAFTFLSITVMLFSIPLAISGGWLYRYKGALATTALTIPYHYLLLNIHSNDPSIIIEAFNPFGFVSLIVFSLSAALLQKLRQQCQNLNDGLEHIVAERTEELHQLADYLLELQTIDRSINNSGLLDHPLELLISMQENSNLLCTSMEEERDPEAANVKIIQQQIRLCVERLTDFMSEAEGTINPQLTLCENVRKLSEKMMRLGGRGLNITMDGECDLVDKEISHQIYSIISEAVSNAIRHAKATEIMIECRQDAPGITICVENDGETLPDRYQEGMGIPLMRHRALSIGGSLTIEGGAGQRTRLICKIPRRAATDEKAFPRSGQRLNTTA